MLSATGTAASPLQRAVLSRGQNYSLHESLRTETDSGAGMADGHKKNVNSSLRSFKLVQWLEEECNERGGGRCQVPLIVIQKA
jgi:hypothetical protein